MARFDLNEGKEKRQWGPSKSRRRIEEEAAAAAADTDVSESELQQRLLKACIPQEEWVPQTEEEVVRAMLAVYDLQLAIDGYYRAKEESKQQSAYAIATPPKTPCAAPPTVAVRPAESPTDAAAIARAFNPRPKTAKATAAAKAADKSDSNTSGEGSFPLREQFHQHLARSNPAKAEKVRTEEVQPPSQKPGEKMFPSEWVDELGEYYNIDVKGAPLFEEEVVRFLEALAQAKRAEFQRKIGADRRTIPERKADAINVLLEYERVESEFFCDYDEPEAMASDDPADIVPRSVGLNSRELDLWRRAHTWYCREKSRLDTTEIPPGRHTHTWAQRRAVTEAGRVTWLLWRLSLYSRYSPEWRQYKREIAKYEPMLTSLPA